MSEARVRKEDFVSPSTHSESSGPPTNLRARVTQVIRQHPLVSFYLLAFSWTWLVDLLVLGVWRQPTGAVEDALRSIIPAVVGAPAFPALLMTRITEGRAGVGRLLRRCVLWRVPAQWYLFVLVGFPALILLVLLAVPGGVTGSRESAPMLALSYVPAFIIIFLVGGPLSEEPAWRGFALPRLERQLGPLMGTLLLGLLWGLWHFPLFLLITGYNGAGTGGVGVGLPFVEFVIGSMALAVIFSWVFHNAHGSVLLTMLLHASENAIIGAIYATQIGYLSVYGAYIALALVIIAATRGGLSYQVYQPFAEQDPHV